LALGALLELLAPLIGALLQPLPVAFHVLEGALEALAALLEQTLIACHDRSPWLAGDWHTITRSVGASRTRVHYRISNDIRSLWRTRRVGKMPRQRAAARYQRSTALAQLKPEPKPVSATRSPRRKAPSRSASASSIGIEAAEQFP